MSSTMHLTDEVKRAFMQYRKLLLVGIKNLGVRDRLLLEKGLVALEQRMNGILLLELEEVKAELLAIKEMACPGN